MSRSQSGAIMLSEGKMSQTERLDHAKVHSVFSSLLAVAAFVLSLGVWIILLSAWPVWWLYILAAASALASFVMGYKARRDLIDLGLYKHSNFYQGLAVISFGCSPLALLMLSGAFLLWLLAYLR